MRRRLAIATAALALFVACQWPGCKKGPLVAKPTSARPGEKIHLHQNRGDFQSFNSLQVTIGGQPSHVSRVISNTDLDVVVPMQTAGNVEIHLLDGDQVQAAAPFSVLETDCRRFVMEMHGNQVRLLRIEPCFDTIDGNAETLDPRLGLDLVNANGQRIYSTSIPHPLETQTEVFNHTSRGATAARHAATDPAVFWVRFPRLLDARGLQVFYVPAGLDIKDPNNLGNRVPIDSLDVTIQ